MVFFFHHVHCLQGCTAETPTGLLWRIVFLVSLVGQLCSNQISFRPLPNLEMHYRVDMDSIPINVRNHLWWVDFWWFK